ncbi:hypothetical protein V6N13_143243 [Hibiscus sabdariffa]
METKAFDAVLWSLWLARNEKIFDGKITNFKDLIFPMKTLEMVGLF